MDNQSTDEPPKLQKRNGRRIILFPLPFQGHINPMLHLANILHSNGFSITIISHTKLNNPNLTNYPNFIFHPISDGLSETEIQYSITDILSLIPILNVKCVEPFRQALVEILADGTRDTVACVISDAILYFTTEVAKSLNLPRIVLRTGGVCSFLAFAALPILIEKGYLPIQEARLEEPVIELPPLRIKDLPAINKSDNPEKLYEIILNMVQETKASSGLIFNSFEELEQPAITKLRQDLADPPVFLIGPFHKLSSSSSFTIEDQSSISSWLDKQADKSVIYVSFGSIASIDKEHFLEVAFGLERSGYPFLWVVRPGLIPGANEWLEILPQDFLENLDGRGHIVSWAPQLEVLAHRSVGLFWTHNGWNSTLESICEGVPMICTSCFTDQLVNARYVSYLWKVGVEFEMCGLKREKVEKTIRGIMGDEEVRERVSLLKEKARLCLLPGGSSYESLKSLKNYISFV